VLVDQTVTIVNPAGLHARPSGALVATAMGFESELRIYMGEREVNGRSILELITLGANCGSKLRLVADGEDASELMEALVCLIAAGFSEMG
jgi:phosphocarrier protein HPr